MIAGQRNISVASAVRVLDGSIKADNIHEVGRPDGSIDLEYDETPGQGQGQAKGLGK